ncbi:hypothetical protein QQ008_16595 [Fulvivirgaceae bacterium BMA10]|uniref:Outer membrane protein beta-barrel domain-containing protein n=1 Tax=Splendidivirga corallicola TaxID=3051826 RepID=A0ABT8KQJ6_9BACT|nr:hypothetical protein [Fulvivirgaceae bacterium BMA10]
MSDKDFEKLFRQKLDGFEAEPTTKSKKRIFTTVIGKQLNGFHPGRQILMAALLLLLFGSMVFVLYVRQSSPSTKTYQSKNINESSQNQQSDNIKDFNSKDIATEESGLSQSEAKEQNTDMTSTDQKSTIESHPLESKQISTVDPKRPEVLLQRSVEQDHSEKNHENNDFVGYGKSHKYPGSLAPLDWSIFDGINTLYEPEFSYSYEIHEEESPVVPQPIKRHSLFLDVSPILTYSQIKPNKSDDILVRNFNTPSDLSFKRLGYRLSLGYEKVLTSRITLRGGITYYGLKYALNYVTQGSRPDSINLLSASENTAQYQVFTQQTEERISKRYGSMGLSASLKYHLKGEKFRHFIVFGMDYQRMLRYNEFIKENENNQFLTPNQIYINAGYKIERDIGKRILLKFQPNLSYSLLANKNTAATFDLKPFGIGVGFGISYYLK